jgi:hypothetical protein
MMLLYITMLSYISNFFTSSNRFISLDQFKEIKTPYVHENIFGIQQCEQREYFDENNKFVASTIYNKLNGLVLAITVGHEFRKNKIGTQIVNTVYHDICSNGVDELWLIATKHGFWVKIGGKNLEFRGTNNDPYTGSGYFIKCHL